MLYGVGVVLVLVSAVLFGAMPIFGKLAFEEGVSSSALLLVRFAMAAILLAGLLLARPQLRRPTPRPDHAELSARTAMSRGRVLAVAVGLGAVGYAAQAGLYFSALQRMDASMLSLIVYIFPVLVTAASVLMGRDLLTGGRVAGLLVASGGVLLVLLGTGGGGSAQPFGVFLAFCTAFVYATYIVVSDTVVHRLPPVVLSTLVMAGAAATLGAYTALTGGVDLSFGWRGWLWIACIAVVSTVLAMLAFFAGLRRTGPSTTSILSTFEPVVIAGLATLTLGETLSLPQLLGGALVLSSVALLQLRPTRSPGRAPIRAKAGSDASRELMLINPPWPDDARNGSAASDHEHLTTSER